MKTKNLITSTVTALVAASSLSASAIAGTIRHDKPDAKYTNLANQPQFASVGRLDMKYSGIDSFGACSGTLIRANWVLTAAHCLERDNGQESFESFESGSFNIGGQSVVIDKAVPNAGWLSSRKLGEGVDLGLFRLLTPVGGINPATLYSGTDEDGRPGTYVGFGWTGNGLSGINSTIFGTKRAGRNIIEQGSTLGYSNQVLVSDFDNPDLFNPSDPSSRPRNLEYQLAPGDSGGALFIGGLLAGVNSFGASWKNTLSRYGDFSGATRVSSQINWIQNTIIGASQTAVVNSLPGTSLNLGLTSLAQVRLDESEVLGDLSYPAELVQDIWDNSEPVGGNSLLGTSSNFDPTILAQAIDESEVLGDLSQPQEVIQDTGDNSEPVVPNSLPGTSSNFDPTILAEVIDKSEVLGDLSQPQEVIQDTGDNSEAVPEPTTVVGGLLSLGGLILARRRRNLAHKQA